MNRKQREDKRQRAADHTAIQKQRKATAITQATTAARELGSDGKPLKQKRTGQKFETALVREMGERGYVQTPTGGWRRKRRGHSS